MLALCFSINGFGYAGTINFALVQESRRIRNYFLDLEIFLNARETINLHGAMVAARPRKISCVFRD